MKIVGDEIHLDIYEMVANVSPECTERIADALSIRDDVIAYVAQQIIGAWTPLNSCGAQSAGVHQQTPLDKAVRLVAKHANDVARREIDLLERAILWRTPKCNECINFGHSMIAGDPVCAGCYGVARSKFQNDSDTQNDSE